MRKIHIIPPDDIQKLPPMRDYAVRSVDIQALQSNDFFSVVRSGSQLILVTAYTGDIDIVMKMVNQIGADMVWLYGDYNSSHGLELTENINKECKVIATLDGHFAYGSARSYSELVAQYRTLLEKLQVSIAFPVMADDAWDLFMSKRDGFNRFSVIYRLVESNIFDVHRDHYLFGLSNPAELAGYAKGFTFAVKNSIKGVMSPRCHSDSRYGIRYSLGSGSLGIPVEVELEPYQYSQQFSTFIANDETISQFIDGCGGDELWDSYKERLNEVSV